MSRLLVPGFLAATLILAVVGMAPTRSEAQSGPEMLTPGAELECENNNWRNADVQPPSPQAAQVVPAAVDMPGFEQELYLVEITLQSGECMPYEATGNHRDGAVVWIVSEGEVAFTWTIADDLEEVDVDPNATPTVEVSDTNMEFDQPLLENQPVLLHEGDWVTQDQRIAVQYSNLSSDRAVILKAVFAIQIGGGCGGGCK